jgi:hypothetical protein
MEENDLSRHPIRETYLVRSIVDSFEVVDLVRRRCRSFSTTSSMCLFNSTSFGSRSSRGLPICFFFDQNSQQNLLFSFDLPDPNIFEFRVDDSIG